MSKTSYGYPNRLIEDLISLLKQYKITALCDVRTAPYSSRNPQYNRELIARFEKKIQVALSRVRGEEADAVKES